MKKRILIACGVAAVCLAVVLCIVYVTGGKKPEASKEDVKGNEVLSGEGDNEQQFEDSETPKEQEKPKDTEKPADSQKAPDSGDSSVNFNDTKPTKGTETPDSNKEVSEGTESSGENSGDTGNSGNTSHEDAGWTGYY